MKRYSCFSFIMAMVMAVALPPVADCLILLLEYYREHSRFTPMFWLELVVLALMGFLVAFCCRISMNRWYGYLILLVCYLGYIGSGLWMGLYFTLIRSQYTLVLLLFAAGYFALELGYELRRMWKQRSVTAKTRF